jgi:threonylcarbamoyladenosine tRNA methylthiotransferase MtaB
MAASEDWLCRHFHIPLQSGDDAILRKMNRDYRAREFTELIDELVKKIPYVAIGLDVMAGFPGEDERAYQRTLSLVKDLPAAYLHVFPYSPRKGTAAADFPGQIDSKRIKSRAAEIRKLGQQKKMSFYGTCLGETFSVLVEGWQSGSKKRIKGFSDNYLAVTFPFDRLLQNEFVPVHMEMLSENGILGQPRWDS